MVSCDLIPFWPLSLWVSCVLVLLCFCRSAVGEKDLKDLNKEVSRCCKAKQTFDRLVLTKEEALDMFDYNAFKK